MTIYGGIICSYVANPMGTMTAAALATAMAAVPVVSSITTITGCAAPTITDSVNGAGQGQVNYEFTFTPKFLGRFPAGSDQRAPFFAFMVSALRSALNHPDLENAVTLLVLPTGAASVAPVSGGAGTTATATVSGPVGDPTPTGTVQFTVNGVNVGAPQTLVAGTVSLALAAGDFPTIGDVYSVGFTYSGDSFYSPATGTPANFTKTVG